MIKKYRKKPVVVEAVLWTGDNLSEITKFMGRQPCVLGLRIEIETLEGVMSANEGDYIIKGIKGEFYPCKSDIFDMTYEEEK